MDKYLDFFTENKLRLNLNNIIDQTNRQLLEKIPGPLINTDLISVIKEIHYNFVRGKKHLLYTKYQNIYGTQKMSSRSCFGPPKALSLEFWGSRDRPIP